MCKIAGPLERRKRNTLALSFSLALSFRAVLVVVAALATRAVGTGLLGKGLRHNSGGQVQHLTQMADTLIGEVVVEPVLVLESGIHLNLVVVFWVCWAVVGIESTRRW